MVGVSVFKTEPLANATNTTDGAHSYRLQKGHALVHITIVATTATGPLHVTAWIYNEGDTARPIVLKEADWVRSDRVFGNPDAWSYDGNVRYQDNSTLRVWVRNDSGEEATWLASWRTEP